MMVLVLDMTANSFVEASNLMISPDNLEHSIIVPDLSLARKAAARAAYSSSSWHEKSA
jgi:hypothetical protein